MKFVRNGMMPMMTKMRMMNMCMMRRAQNCSPER